MLKTHWKKNIYVDPISTVEWDWSHAKIILGGKKNHIYPTSRVGWVWNHAKVTHEKIIKFSKP